MLVESWIKVFEGDDVREMKGRLQEFVEMVVAAMNRCPRTTKFFGTAENSEVKIGFDMAPIAQDVRALLALYRSVLLDYAEVSVGSKSKRPPVKKQVVRVQIPEGSGTVLHIELPRSGKRQRTLVVTERGLQSLTARRLKEGGVR